MWRGQACHGVAPFMAWAAVNGLAQCGRCRWPCKWVWRSTWPVPAAVGVNPQRVKVAGWYGLINTQSMFRTLFKDTFGYKHPVSFDRSSASLAENPAPTRPAAGQRPNCRLSVRADLSGRKVAFQAAGMGLAIAIEKLHGCLRQHVLPSKDRRSTLHRPVLETGTSRPSGATA